MIKIFSKLFGKKQEEIKEQAIVVPMFDKDLEFKDLEKKHAAFFNQEVELPVIQMQSKIGNNEEQQVQLLAHISDVNMSRSQKFFTEAPEVELNNEHPEVQEDFEKLEGYMGIHIHKNEEELEAMAVMEEGFIV